VPKNISRRRMQRSKSTPRAKETKKVNSLFPARLLDSGENSSLLDGSSLAEPVTKAPRTSPESGPSSRGLCPPHFAGNALQVGDVDDELWEAEVFGLFGGMMRS